MSNLIQIDKNKSNDTHQLSSPKITNFHPFKNDKIADILNAIMSDIFTIHLKSKKTLKRKGSPHFLDYQLLSVEQAKQFLDMNAPVSERIDAMGRMTLESINEWYPLADYETINDEKSDAELLEDNQKITSRLRDAHKLCRDYDDVATIEIIERWIKEREEHIWFMYKYSDRNH